MSEQRELADCKELFALLSQYLDLELPEETCAKMQAHFAACPPCIEFVESLRKTIQLVGRYQPGCVPRPLSAEAREKLLLAWNKTQT